MRITGRNREGERIERRWYIIVKKGEGPNVPAIPSIILGNKICLHNLSLPGVHACVGLVTLEEYLDGLKEYHVETFTDINKL